VNFAQLKSVRLEQRSCPTAGPVIMGDQLRADKPSQYITRHSGQLSLDIPLWVGATSTSNSWGVKQAGHRMY